jgi:hypothetical protein
MAKKASFLLRILILLAGIIFKTVNWFSLVWMIERDDFFF